MESRYPDRLLLSGVPRVAFHDVMSAVDPERCPEDVPFPSCMRAAFQYLGEDYGSYALEAHGRTWRFDHGYALFMGTSGAAFRLSWGSGWQPDNTRLRYISTDPEAPVRRAFAATGYRHAVMRHDAGEAVFCEAIFESLRRGRPVIAFGVIGPPEACLVTGYDECGDVLMGWSFFQDGAETEPTGEFRARGWFANTEAIALIGVKHDRPPLTEFCRGALRWALTVARTAVTDETRASGHAAYAAWADALLRDEAFEGTGPDALRRRFEVHDDAVLTVAEGRWYAAGFLRRIAAAEPAMEKDLLAAADCHEAQHTLMWAAWDAVGGMGRSPEKAQRLADRSVRCCIARIIREARERDMQAAIHIERALARAG